MLRGYFARSSGPGSWAVCQLLGSVEIDKYRCHSGNVAEFSTGRERLLGTAGGGAGGGRNREREMGREKENSFIILCPNKSCFVTVLQIMLPLFAKSLQTVCETEL